MLRYDALIDSIQRCSYRNGIRCINHRKYRRLKLDQVLVLLAIFSYSVTDSVFAEN